MRFGPPDSDGRIPRVDGANEMPITPPVVDTEISASAFGVPVANTLNTMGSIARQNLVARTVAGSTNVSVFSVAYTVPAHVVGILALIVFQYTMASGNADLAVGNTVLASITQAGTTVTTAHYYAKSGSTVTVGFNVSAWSGTPVNVSERSMVTSFPITTLVTGTVFP